METMWTLARVAPAPPEQFVAVLLLLGAFFFWIAQIADVALRRFPQPAMKARWLLAVLLLPLVGAIIYQGLGKRRGRLPEETSP